ncbi:hypothetical protein EJ06DRAFT_34190 [Trichodelitschia bisporula]|uniref:Uncharacterized protein n=1 Tax=Trichodelitschia bisporula TaxID=703511 RepID=A0A6G1HV74_9PEZI|nr:hypothetical protein EJ06DRAFT_34190 [Trichodelitschia bisporula]
MTSNVPLHFPSRGCTFCNSQWAFQWAWLLLPHGSDCITCDQGIYEPHGDAARLAESIVVEGRLVMRSDHDAIEVFTASIRGKFHFFGYLGTRNQIHCHPPTIHNNPQVPTKWLDTDQFRMIKDDYPSPRQPSTICSEVFSIRNHKERVSLPVVYSGSS